MEFKTVDVQLDKLRTLSCNMFTVVTVEREVGKGFFHVLKRIQEDPRIEDIAILLWAALKKEEPSLAVEQATGLITWENFGEITGKVIEAYGMSKEEAIEESPFSGSNGQTSGLSQDTTSG